MIGTKEKSKAKLKEVSQDETESKPKKQEKGKRKRQRTKKSKKDKPQETQNDRGETNHKAKTRQELMKKIKFGENDTMTRHDRSWVPRAMVSELEEAMTKRDQETDGDSKAKLHNEYRTLKKKAREQLIKLLSKTVKAEASVSSLEVQYEENDLMTQYRGVWVKRAVVAKLDEARKPLDDGRELSKEERQEAEKKVSKMLQCAHRKLHNHLMAQEAAKKGMNLKKMKTEANRAKQEKKAQKEKLKAKAHKKKLKLASKGKPGKQNKKTKKTNNEDFNTDSQNTRIVFDDENKPTNNKQKFNKNSNNNLNNKRIVFDDNAEPARNNQSYNNYTDKPFTNKRKRFNDDTDAAIAIPDQRRTRIVFDD